MSINIISLHGELWSQLQAQRDRLAHALLFVGREGIGKYEFAQAFAHSLLCEQPRADGFACGQCAACNWLAQGNHPDFRELRPEAMDEAEEGGEKKKGGRGRLSVVPGDQPRRCATPLRSSSSSASVLFIISREKSSMARPWTISYWPFVQVTGKPYMTSFGMP